MERRSGDWRTWAPEDGASPPQAVVGMQGVVHVDPYRAFVFPNRMREHRRRQGYPRLLRFASALPEIPYIRLSKIERGEVFARPEELRSIAGALGIAPADLLIDVDAPDFDIAGWAAPFLDEGPDDSEEQRFAVLLGAAVRARRNTDPDLTIAAIERDHGLPPVNLSRIENAQKPFARWNAPTQQALYSLFGVDNEAALRARVSAQHRAGALADFLGTIANPELRHQRTRARIRELAEAFGAGEPRIEPQVVTIVDSPAPAAPIPASPPPSRLLAVLGAPLAGGLIAAVDSGDRIEAPQGAGPRAFALRVCRATLGGGLPGQSVVVVDPDRYPVPGGLAAVREGEAWRLLAVASDRDGRMTGHSTNPPFDCPIDERDPADVAAVVSAQFPAA